MQGRNRLSSLIQLSYIESHIDFVTVTSNLSRKVKSNELSQTIAFLTVASYVPLYYNMNAPSNISSDNLNVEMSCSLEKSNLACLSSQSSNDFKSVSNSLNDSMNQTDEFVGNRINPTVKKVNFLLQSTEPEYEQKPSYSSALLRYKDSEKLINHFIQDTSGLRESDACGLTFTIDASLKRLIKGYTLVMFTYSTGETHRASLSADKYRIFIKEPLCLEKCIPYSHFKGIILGSASSAFSRYNIDDSKLSSLGLMPTDCFSLLTESRTYDFGTPSSRARYDIIQLFSFHLANQSLSASFPLSKSLITRIFIKAKIEAMAKEKGLLVKELLIVCSM